MKTFVTIIRILIQVSPYIYDILDAIENEINKRKQINSK